MSQVAYINFDNHQIFYLLLVWKSKHIWKQVCLDNRGTPIVQINETNISLSYLQT